MTPWCTGERSVRSTCLSGPLDLAYETQLSTVLLASLPEFCNCSAQTDHRLILLPVAVLWPEVQLHVRRKRARR